ncbi:MAG TPA: NADH:flavin oxidoreductase/NADH oxidase [Dongiaceae bacterium]|nr:NADH:flavin oxidoreductase/NADH oxidase [Dongiaceae bacterium]
MPHLFDELRLRDITLRNRIGVSPMCQYSSREGLANDWHFTHLTSRAVGGAGLVFTEAAAVTPEGRISPQDLGVWSEKHFEPLARITHFIDQQGSIAGIQLAHAGRKASTHRPWSGHGKIDVGAGGWQTVAPSAEAFADDYPMPTALAAKDIAALQEAFVEAAERAYHAGFRVIEIHAAHGYLFHEFLSPLSNHRADQYGGSFENRTRFLRDTVRAVRADVPDRCPLFVRISATDWAEGGWDIEQSIELARQLKALGVDMIDTSSGGNVKDAQIPVGPGYQTPFAARIRREAGVATAAVGLITGAAQADHIVRGGEADLVLLARELLRSPYWPLEAARELGHDATWPAQYLRAAPKGAQGRTPAHEID